MSEEPVPEPDVTARLGECALRMLKRANEASELDVRFTLHALGRLSKIAPESRAVAEEVLKSRQDLVVHLANSSGRLVRVRSDAGEDKAIPHELNPMGYAFLFGEEALLRAFVTIAGLEADAQRYLGLNEVGLAIVKTSLQPSSSATDSPPV